MIADNSLSNDFALAHHLAAVACETALGYVERGVTSQLKADGTAVTEADLEIERRLFELLARLRPDDGVLGEELGARGGSERRWLIDPIDGTMNFLAGRADWGNHVALLHGEQVVLGVITRPLRGQTWSACRGGGAHRIERACPSRMLRLQVSQISELRASRVAAWASDQDPVVERLKREGVWVPSDLDAILRLAEGELEAVVDPSGKPWDHAPAVVIVEEAGGTFSDRNGGRRLDLGEGRFTNRLIQRQLEELLADDHEKPMLSVEDR